MSIRSPLVGKTEYEKKPGIVPAIQRNPAFGPGNIEYEIAVASGVFI